MDRPLFDPDKVAGPPRAAPAPSDVGVLTVSQVTAMVKRAIADALPATLHVVGQISNFKRHSSGHVYLTLKDDRCELSAVMWRSAAARLKFKPENGLEVIATGQLDVFERAGRYQLLIRRLEPRGVGALELAFRQLRQKLEAEGLFDHERKKLLPKFPRRIGVVTSPTGAAIRDILRTLHRRYPAAEVCLYPVSVQGPTAGGEIANAIRHLDRRHGQVGGIDVLIVGRGGGSLEDLWAFNEEVLARAIFACGIPIVSAVGHETDVTISDLVADARAATPTAAAELVTPDRDEVLTHVTQQQARMVRAVTHRAALLRSMLDGLLQRSVFRDPLTPVHRREQVIDELATRLARTACDRIHDRQRTVSRAELLLQRIHPHVFVSRTARSLSERWHRLQWALARRLAEGERRLAQCTESLRAGSPAPQIGRLAERIDRFDRRLLTAIEHRLKLAAARVDADGDKLEAMSYRRTLARGFSITRTKKGRRVVRAAKTLRPGDRLLTEIADGEVESRVVDGRQGELFEP